MRILLCSEITCGSMRKTVNLQVELVSDVVAAQATIQGENKGEKSQGTAAPEAAKAARTWFHDYF
jgi:hypothetical protein